GGVVFGRRVLASVDELPEGIDVAVILTPADTVPAIVDGCGRKGIRWAIVETGGFGEYSEEGRRLEEDLLRVARRWGIRLIGPNGIGIINMGNGFVTPFFPLRREALREGKVGIISQSGGVVFALINLLASSNIGVSKVVSMGNKLDLDEIDYLTYLVQDEETEIIVLYLESISHGCRLTEIAKETKKSIIVQKVNIYPSSTQIARFHTAALATDDRVVSAAFRGAGIVRARDYREVVNFVKIFSIPPMKGNNLLIISRSGGIAISASDFAEEHGFQLYPLSEAFLRRVQKAFRAKVITPTNPLDVGDLFDFNFYTQITEEVLKEEGVNGVLFQHAAAPGLETEESIKLGKAFDNLAQRYQKPIALCFLSDEQSIAFVKKSLDYPMFTEPGEALPALAVSRDRYRRSKEIEREKPPPSFFLDREEISEIMQRARAAGRPLLLHEALDVVTAAGIKTAPYFLCRDLEEAMVRAKELGYPLALKVNTPSILHKTDMGGVALDIKEGEKLRDKFGQLLWIPEKLDHQGGILLQKFVTEGVEMILGGKVDEGFGPIVLLGFGGIYAEVFGDTTLRVLPLTEREAEGMIAELRGYPLLRGARGNAPFDLAFLKEALLRLSQLMIDFPQIKGVDLNPLFLFQEGEGGMVVDARIITEV
ncbi:MAG: acetate--CoA ligase family protein, partial [Deltaproteobacteria bacterium]|nr:acetate--CoA ligase family protein [Deltaproteobacteria bacterium]